MFRRARFSVKPNVRPSATGRGNSGSSVVPAAAPPDPGAQHGLAPTACSSAAAVGSPTIQPGAPAGDLQRSGGGTSNNSSDEKTSDERGDGDCSKHTETVLQRRKRISTMPNLAKPRVVPSSTQRAVSSMSKGSQKQIPHSPPFGNSPLQKESPTSEKIHVDISPKSPILPEKKTPVPQVPQFSPFKKSASKDPNSCVTGQRNDEALQKSTSSPLKERPTQEKMIQEEITQSKSSPAKEKRICSDREKIIKTQKLRKLLKEELKKEKEQRKYKCPVIEKPMPEDRSKMIMRDFIYYLPENNPMKTSLVEEKKAEKTSTITQAKEPEERLVAELDDENEEDEEEDGGEVEDDGPLLVPRVKVAEDGSIILDEESLTVEVLRTKGQCVVEENDPIFERGSTTTYSSFRKSYYTKPWSEKETDMFFLAISMVGTDFSMISQLFPHRARTEIKNKFKREEKANGWRIDKAFKEKRPFDFDFFAKLLEKILENERKKKEKDAKCQHQKEKNPNEKKAPKSQKKRKAKVVNGQINHGQDDLQNARMSDAEMEVDAETAEKENEESPSILEQAEGQAVTESIVTKKKRKRKKKDSEYEAENLPEERIIPAEMAERETSRKKRKSTSSSVEFNGTGEVGDELEDPDGATPDETILLVEEDPQCCIQFNEEAEGDSSSTLSSTQDNVFIEAESGELNVPEASSVHHVGQPSKSQMSLNTDKNSFDGTDAAKSKIAELDKLDENQNTPPTTHDEEIMETDRSATEKPTIEGRLQRLTSDVVIASEKIELSVSDTSEIKISPSEPMDGAEKTNVEDKTADITGPIIEETSRINNGMEIESLGTQTPLAEKMEVRGRRQRPKPNIVKASSRKEAPVHGKLDKPEPDGTVEKDDAASVTTEESAEKDCQILTTEPLICKKSTSQESSKQTVLKPAPLTRGRMQRPKPNLERIARRQKGPARNTEAEEEKAAIEAEKPLIEPECNSRELLRIDTIEAPTYEADMPHSEALENKAVASAVKESSKYTSKSPVKKPLGCKSHNPPTTSLSSNSVEDAADFATRDFRLQQEQKEISAEMEHSLKSYSLSPKENIGKVSEREEPVRAEGEMIGNKNETETAEKSLVNITSECSKSSNLDEAAKCGILASSLLLEEPPADVQEAVATNKTLLSPQNLSGFKTGEPNEVLLSPDIQKKVSVGKQSSQEESKQSAIRPTPLLRGRFQRPKPNIGRAIGRKEMQPVGTNEAATAVVGNEKSELKKSEPSRTPPTVTPLKCDSKALPVEALEKKLVDTEKVNQEDSQMPGTSQNISEQFSRGKPISQEDKSYTIKPAQLVRGRFQRARPNLGRTNGKKEEPVTENVSAPVEGEVGKTEITVVKKDDLNAPKDEVSVQAPLSNLEKKERSESSNAPSPKRCIDQKKHSSSEKSQGCELLKDQEEMCVLKEDDEGKHRDIPGSDISASQEIRQSKSIKPIQHMRGHPQKPKPNLARAAKKKEASLEAETSTEGKTERATENDATLHGNNSGKISTVMHNRRNLVEAASFSESLRQKNCTGSIGTGSLTRSKDSGKCDSSEQSSGSERQIPKEISKPPSAHERASETLKGKQPGRTLKQRKTICDSRTVPTTENENVHGEKGKHHQKVKPNVSRGRSLRPALRKKPRKEYGSSKVNLVTLRASSQEEEDDDDGDDDDFEPDYEVECFSPEEVNKAPVFVPKGLRSPNPVPVQIEETMEEVEIYENVADEPFLSHELSVIDQPVIQGDKDLYTLQDVITEEEQNKQTGINDGSTEAAMTLLAMRDPAFQLNISSQELPSKDELNVPNSFPDEHNEEQSIVDCNVACSALSKHELVSSDNTNKAATEDHGTEPSGLEECFQEATDISRPASSKNEVVSSHSANEVAPEYHNSPVLEECSQETTRVGRDLSSSKGSKTSRIARCSFPKPKPNLNRVLGLNRNTPQKFLALSSGVEQTNAIQNEEKVSESAVEEQKVELDFKLDKLAKSSSAEKQDLQPGSAGPAIQTNDTERENLVRETWELNAPKLSPEAETYPLELENDPNGNINVQASDPIECLQLSTVEVAQTEASKYSSISATTEMTAVSSGSSKEHPDVEEPTFILTLVEISADPADCSIAPPSLLQTSEELLPAPVFLTPDNIDSVELTRAHSIGSVTAAAPDNTRERRGLQVASSKHLGDLGSTSWKNLKRCTAAFKGSGDPPEKKKTLSTGENLESFEKETSLKRKCIPRKAAETPPEKLNISKKKISSTYRPVTETTELQAEEREQSSLNLGAKLLDEAASTSEQVSRTLHAGKAETSEKQRNFVDTCKSVQSEQVGSAVVLPKPPPARSYQRSLGFLPLICKNNTDEVVATKGNKQSHQQTHKMVSENTVGCPTLFSRNNSEESQEGNSFPSTISSPSKCENEGSSTIKVFSELSEHEGSSKEQEKEEEPTRISEYFFSDIFMEVDDSE
ncbi:transcription factor TFIIIB component B'' homolog [Elgaria multicarinata webbii]|uniref:transcription factor TFIIIB component B'' homolog n=1 Tax=Elgaria multicarinata webbii TaxID=159646 RepID=UPI002FCD0471